MMTPRPLTSKELTELKQLNLSPKVEEVVRRCWESQPQPKIKMSIEIFSYAFPAVMLALLLLEIFHKETFNGVGNIATGFIIIVATVMLLGQLCVMIFHLSGRVEVRNLGQASMQNWQNKLYLSKIYSRCIFFAIICLLFYVGSLKTGILLALALLVNYIALALARQTIQKEIDKIEGAEG